MIKFNVGGLDRAIRIAIGLAVLSLFFIYPDSQWRYAALVGFVPLLTGAFGSCPLYAVLGISTCSPRRA